MQNLPPETIEFILSLCDKATLQTCRSVCRSLAAIVDHSVLLQYKLELSLACMDDAPLGVMDLSTRLKKLRAHQMAWRTWDWSGTTVFPMRDGNAWELMGGVLGQTVSENTSSTQLVFRQIPSIHRGIAQKDWSIDDIGFHVADFTIDPSQDVLVAVETPNHAFSRHHVHVRSLSSGCLHPATSISSPITYSSAIDPHSYSIQVMGDLLGILFDAWGASELLIWNWKTGHTQKKLIGRSLQSFTFLNEALLMIGVCDTSSGVPSLRIVRFDAACDAPVNVKHAPFFCSFLYPSISVTAGNPQLAIQAEPPPRLSLAGPFSTSYRDRLIVVTCRCGIFGVTEKTSVLCIPLSLLLAKIDAVDTGKHISIFQWEDWGPGGTRMFSFIPSPVWVCFVHGMKLLHLDRNQVLNLFDFGSLTSRHGLRGSSSLVFTESICDAQSQIFQEPVVTSLPFRHQSCVLPASPIPRFAAAMLSEDAILLVSPRDEYERYVVMYI